MKKLFDLGELDWTLAGWTPYVWRQQRSIESGSTHNAEVPSIPARVPGSVQGALRDAGILPDWNVALNARLCEWVENRHWIYTTRLPDEWWRPGMSVSLQALGLDHSGWILVNGKECGRFVGALVPHVFDLSEHLRGHDDVLQIVFDLPPRWLGQIGYTSRMTDWKPRFNYFWDWTSRLVQLGVWDRLLLEVSDGAEISALVCTTSADPDSLRGSVAMSGTVAKAHDVTVRLQLERSGAPVRTEEITPETFARGVSWTDLAVELWWPNGEGDHPLYTLRCSLLDVDGAVVDETSREIGFKALTWSQCAGAPEGADPWLCVVNHRPVFLQGVNWTPILPNFADVTDAQYEDLLQKYRDLGCNMLRVWGGAFLEKQIFYELCDRLGLLVWQEFPLSSSGLDNWPPEEPKAIEEMASIARSYIQRRRHHVSLAVWCGGNELQGSQPVDSTHPMIARLADVVAVEDPEHRFLPSSPSGPSFGAEPENFGKGVHWDVHGPWHARGDLNGEWTRYWANNDALFHSEIGTPGASSSDLIRAYKGDLSEVPGTTVNPLWRRTSWWIEWPAFVSENGREPLDLDEYVGWSQDRQRRALAIAAQSARDRFPSCGGFLIWMGHDSFPCTANTAIIDFHGQLKPAAHAIGQIFRSRQPDSPPGAVQND